MARGEQALALGRWIAETWDWQAFFTVTLKDHQSGHRAGTPVGVAKAERVLTNWLEGSIGQRGASAYWWAAMESHRYRSTPHFHGLIGGVETRDRWMNAAWWEWRSSDELAGRAQIVPIRDVHGVAVYVAKYVNKGLGKIYTSRSLDLWKKKAPPPVRDSTLGWSDAGKGRVNVQTSQVERHEG